MTLTSSATALALASGGFLAWDCPVFEGELRTELHTQARVDSRRQRGAIEFRRPAKTAR